MSGVISRRALLGGLLAGVALPATAGAPLTSLRPVPRGAKPPAMPPPAAAKIIRDARLGGSVGYAVADAKTGKLIEAYNADARMPPASVAKAVTAYYARTHLGPDHVFSTRLIAMGPITNGRLEGDLALVGGGDPTLDTDALGGLVEALRDTGIHTVTGRLRIFAGALPQLRHIDPEQPDHVGYNPSVSGLNLNFNRVHFEWKRVKEDYAVTMQARDLRFRPSVEVAQMSIDAERRFPVFSYNGGAGIDRWSVARAALGREGARWLPVRRAARYSREVFISLARSYGLVLKPGPDLEAPPRGEVLAVHNSAPLEEIIGSMLRYSTNLSAEVLGLAATKSRGTDPHSLIASARDMNRWIRNDIGPRTTGFVDHSGLGDGSRITPSDMVRILAHAGPDGPIRPLLKTFAIGNDRLATSAEVRAKTGTLNFVSGLAGYIRANENRELVFAIFTADPERRDAIRIEDRERPPGSRSWSRRSRAMQKQLIRRWLELKPA
ncbi:MAG: D-alanyl-D-alanine carboxypeptidase/D-alanyl-D-alanine-endopeptidase [Alphaproteobacteria bacterium]|nr:D-alanyl-D-alanine carboxypeptidase/D-alanyl-D-alanine-endopeptidase [Alphaproteobacteria bacterium]NNF24008.1 D-alanyl-D-alanine carboxypeptidase/D-alanyl-D-alanine-endopeptidase [Paracoccaceae bacterium]